MIENDSLNDPKRKPTEEIGSPKKKIDINHNKENPLTTTNTEPMDTTKENDF